MGIKLSICISLLLCSVLAWGQAVVVYHTTGNAFIKDAGSKTPAVKGSVISKAALLELKGGSTCMLIGQKGASTQIDKPGVYAYSRILQLISAAKTETVSSKFFAYVYDNLVYKKEKTSLNVTPVVYRAEPLMKTPQQYGFFTANQNIGFSWRRSAIQSPIHFQLLAYNDSVILDTVFKREQLSVVLSSKTAGLKGGKIYKWNVEEQYNSTKIKVYYFFIMIDENDVARHEQAWKSINNAPFTKEVKLALHRDLLLQRAVKN